MKVFFYINSIGNGGAERVLTVLANQIAAQNNDVTVITSIKREWEYPLLSHVCRITLDRASEKTNRIKKNLVRISKLRAICKSERPDVLISFMEEPNYRALVAAMGLGTKTIISVRTDPAAAYGRGLARFLAKTLYRCADGYVFQTKQARQWFVPAIQKKSTVIVNPVSENFYSVCGSPGVEKRIVASGRLNSAKNFDLLLESFSLIAEQFRDYTLTIYGSGELKETLEEKIEVLSLTGRAELFGQCNDIPNAIKDASLFVMSSDVEGLPNALMEAMTLGLPVITTDFAGGGAKALIENGVNGLIVPVNDKYQLARAMEQLLTDREYAQRLGNAAKAAAEAFRTETIARKWIRYIEQVVDT